MSGKTDPDRVIIFSRYPVPGRTKTRLIPRLGPVGAAELHRRLAIQTLQTVKKSSGKRNTCIEACMEGGSRRKIRAWLGPLPILSYQRPGDLGRRMFHAFGKAFRDGCRRVLLVGADIPGLTERHLSEAFEALRDHDVVLGPSTDGGYWLVGLKRTIDIFQGIQWGTKTVLEDTVSLSRRTGLRLYLLDPLTDIDTIEDLGNELPWENVPAPYVSVIIPTLNEEAHIRKTIHSARDEEAEIIVVDGGSIDETAARALDSGAEVFTSPPGRALQQNLGALAGGGKTLLFLHGDTLLPKGYVNRIFETFMDSGVVAGAFRFGTDLKHPFMKIVEVFVSIRSGLFQLPYGDQGLFMRRSVFRGAGGFPEVPVAEDLFLVRSLKKKGRVHIAPARAITSARRWKRLGLVRTTITNYRILAGCLLGVSPDKLANLYRIPSK